MRKNKQKIDNRPYILSNESSFLVQEAYKNLRTNVQFSMPSGECKIIGITSAERGDGKSTTAINLAISFAQIGKRVMLIDGDLRMPTVAGKLEIPGTPGVSNYIVGKNTLSDVCQLHEQTGLYVLPSGNIPPDATWLLQSERMSHMLEELKKAFDYIFIDLPPVTVVSDAMILAKMVDGYLLVVQSGATMKKNIAEMIASLRFIDAKILGFVNTRSEDSGKSYYYRKKGKKHKNGYGYYSYGYGYGYGYGHHTHSSKNNSSNLPSQNVPARMSESDTKSHYMT